MRVRLVFRLSSSRLQNRCPIGPTILLRSLWVGQHLVARLWLLHQDQPSSVPSEQRAGCCCHLPHATPSYAPRTSALTRRLGADGVVSGMDGVCLVAGIWTNSLAVRVLGHTAPKYLS